MALRINDVAPDFTTLTTRGEINFHDWLGGSWAVLFSHPKDFTPVCTTELGAVAALKSGFASRGVKVIGLSMDTIDDHARWNEDIRNVSGYEVDFPIIGDIDLHIAKLYDMLPADASDTSTERNATMNAPVRTVFIIGPDKRIKVMIAYPMTTGRNFDEIIRVIDSLQLTSAHKVATPANWQQGQNVIITSAVSDDEASTLFPGFRKMTPYLRFTEQPNR